MQTKQVEKILLIDIETVPVVEHYEQLSPVMQREWIKKHNRLAQLQSISAAEAFEQAGGIYAEFGKIICIAVAFINESSGQARLYQQVFAGHNEHELLANFTAFLVKHKSIKAFAGHNIREFDIPYICRRLLVNSLALPSLLNISGKKPYEIDYLIDTLQNWKFGDYKHYTSLALLCELFGLPSPKDDLDGSLVAQTYWQEADLPRIVAYCEADVLAVARLLQKMKLIDFPQAYSALL